ncbi:MAG: transaldolase [Mycobacteriales bacterium]
MQLMSDRLAELSAAGVAVWLDDLSRQRLVDDADPRSIAALTQSHHVVGITSNPTIFAKALDPDSSGMPAYEAALAELAARGVNVDDAVRELTTADVASACDKLRGVYERTSHTDGRVSIEVDPRLAHDTEATVANAAALWAKVDRPNLFIKIPATRQGLPAITRTLAAGINVNVTLVFSLSRYREVIEAFLDGMEQAQAAGRDLSEIASVASFFVSRIDTEVDKRLDIGVKDGDLDPDVAQRLRGKAAIANARLAYAHAAQVFAGQRWEALAAAGAHPQRPLWASTGVKDPAYDDTRYVTELVAAGTVNTMPEATLNAVADHAVLRGDTVTGSYHDAKATLAQVASVGIDFDDVVQTLEREGVESFADSWHELLASMAHQLGNR